MLPNPAPQVLTVPIDASGERLDHWLVLQLPEVSRVRVQQLIEQQKILVNGKLPKPSLRLRGGEEITITGPVTLPPLKAFPENIPLEIVYEDDSIVILNKPAGMIVHAGSGKDQSGSKGTLVNALLHHFSQLSQVGGDLRPGIVHRLDKDTSGLLIVAKTDAAHRRLAEQFSRRTTRKTYIALVHGWMAATKGTISTPISRDLVRRARMTTRRVLGREAVTHWKTLQQIDGPYGKFSLLEVSIETGRTHQIRVHLSSLGHPVVGDTLYGAPRELKMRQEKGKSAALGRNFLHAAAIQFRHPVSDTPLSFKQPMPAELDLFLAQIGGK
ncbi:MAG TPA: RluA family pseudouridine synthase [Candidatus Angelobacter sp.]